VVVAVNINKPEEPKKTPVTDIDSSSVSFITRVATILACLSDGTNTVTDIAKCCNLSTSTTHRLLNALKKPLFTVYDGVNHRYYLGPLITRLASNSSTTHQFLLMNALPEMKRLSAITEETIALDVVVGIQFVHLYDIPSKYSLKVITETREIQPITPLGAAQKVLLAQFEEKALGLALKVAANWDSSFRNIQNTEITSTLKQIRQQGYAVTHGEAIPGGIGISAPIKNYFCPVALAILGPENRVSPRIPELTKELLTSAGRLSKNMLDLFS
jgi:IclR family KDG regulon transcriptional repressor